MSLPRVAFAMKAKMQKEFKRWSDDEEQEHLTTRKIIRGSGKWSGATGTRIGK